MTTFPSEGIERLQKSTSNHPDLRIWVREGDWRVYYKIWLNGGGKPSIREAGRIRESAVRHIRADGRIDGVDIDKYRMRGPYEA